MYLVSDKVAAVYALMTGESMRFREIVSRLPATITPAYLSVILNEKRLCGEIDRQYQRAVRRWEYILTERGKARLAQWRAAAAIRLPEGTSG